MSGTRESPLIGGVQITATLATCPRCNEAMVLRNGVIVSRVTFWTKDGILSMVTPHADGCWWEGRSLDQTESRTKDPEEGNEEARVRAPGKRAERPCGCVSGPHGGYTDPACR